MTVSTGAPDSPCERDPIGILRSQMTDSDKERGEKSGLLNTDRANKLEKTGDAADNDSNEE